jgi:hypothetical protein
MKRAGLLRWETMLVAVLVVEFVVFSTLTSFVTG